MKKRIISIFAALALTFGAVSFAAPTEEENTPSAAEETTDLAPTSTPEASEVPEEIEEDIQETLPSPEPSAEPTAAPNTDAVSNSVDITIEMLKHPLVQDSFAKLELYSADGTLLASAREWVGGITKEITLHFDVPQYTLGESFGVKLAEGLNYIQYYDDKYYPGTEFTVKTYGYTDDNGNYIKGNSFTMTGDPIYKKAVVMYNQHGMMSLSPKARIIDGVTYVPVRAMAESLGLNVRYDSRYNSVAVGIGNKEIAYNIGSPVTNFFGTDSTMQGATRSIEGFVFVPVRSLADAFETGIEVLDFGDHIDVVLGKSQLVENYYQSFYVNQKKIGSKTNYLVWVSKSEYKVRAYKGQQGRWVPIAEFPCAIGAPGTPTITGQFEYFSRESSWDYPGYYVGPIMRFYNGYALHSTLRYYGGGEYDGRVGVQISHGCVRLHPSDITWLVNTIPLHSRIWVTE
ncbi:MAG: stalk domain-containing protein [Clostridia bacterium]|nr:stalk domain-containing protein [Clostridia bacterium]